MGRASSESSIRELRRRNGRCTSYLMNPALSGVRLADIRDPARTVLLEKAEEFHPGYRIVGYADGHVAAIRVQAR